MKNIFLILCGIFFYLNTPASIRIVRGGGLAEMQMISIHQNLAQHIRICVQTQNPCGLKPVVLKEYQNLYQTHESVARSINLTFVPKFQSPRQIYARSQSGITLSSQSLYTQQSQALEFKHLLALMVAIRLEIQGSTQTFQENLLTAQKIWQQMHQQHQAHRANVTPRLLVVHTYQFSFLNQNRQSVYLEDKNRTYDLTEYVTAELPCGDLSQWRFQQWQTRAQGNQIYYVSQALASCAEGRPSLIIKIDLDPQGLVVGPSIRIQFRY